MGRVEGKVAFISGIARGQGRSHAVRLAEEGAAIIGFDVRADNDAVEYPLATTEDLDETVRLVEKAGGRIHVAVADVRDYDAVRTVLDEIAANLQNPAAYELAGVVAARAPLAVQMIKRAVYQGLDQDLRTALDMISSHMAVITATEDSAEAFAAFTQNRDPVFRRR
jgi:NAD(P)-dependent dehydrogenase (short-subunit alcohol dehydrogenase family)